MVEFSRATAVGPPQRAHGGGETDRWRSVQNVATEPLLQKLMSGKPSRFDILENVGKMLAPNRNGQGRP